MEGQEGKGYLMCSCAFVCFQAIISSLIAFRAQLFVGAWRVRKGRVMGCIDTCIFPLRFSYCISMENSVASLCMAGEDGKIIAEIVGIIMR